MSFNWKNVLLEIVIWSTALDDNVRINGSDILSSKTPLFPSCQPIDISKYWTFNVPIDWLSIRFDTLNNIFIWLQIEDKQKALVKRSIGSSSLAYEGSQIKLKELKPAKYKKYFITISQQRSLESSSDCKHYPTNGFANYQECDEDFVYKEMKNKYKVMPFWAAKTLDEVTQFT